MKENSWSFCEFASLIISIFSSHLSEPRYNSLKALSFKLYLQQEAPLQLENLQFSIRQVHTTAPVEQKEDLKH